MKQETGPIPDNHVIGVLKSNDEAAIRQHLRDAGYVDVAFLSEQDVADQVDPDAANTNPVVRLVYQFINHLSEQRDYLEQYEEAARQGNRVVAVQVADEDQAQQVKEVLLDHGVMDLRFFGKLAVRDLTPESNPSASSDQLP